ncbi:MAG: (4Fe-4S)-binding protein [Bacteroidota bacterium]
MKSVTKNYSNGEVTIVWKNALCIHSKKCWTGLNTVFNPNEKPWIKPGGASTQQVIEQVKKCPSGALTYFMNNEVEKAAPSTGSDSEIIIEIAQNGPLLVYGNINLKDHHGIETKKNNITALCRCGHSSNKPFCDGSHVKVNFSGQ